MAVIGETCGTCSLWIRDPIESASCDVGYGACHASLNGGMYSLKREDHVCDSPMSYECVSTLERVAADLYDFVHDCDGKRVGTCRRCEFAIKTGTPYEFECDAPRVFRERLLAVGVMV